MIRGFSVTFTWLCFLALSLVVLGCAADTDVPAQNQEQESTQDASTPEPTFVRVTVTPVPMDTPIPTTVAKTQFTAEQLADPVFPDWLDPGVATERPSDDEILSGWTEFLTDVKWSFDGSELTTHLCSDGSVYWNDLLAPPGVGQDWEVARNPTLSDDDWGYVNVQTKVSEFQRNGILSLDSETWNSQDPIVFERSRQCLELAAE